MIIREDDYRKEQIKIKLAEIKKRSNKIIQHINNYIELGYDINKGLFEMTDNQFYNIKRLKRELDELKF